MKLIGLLVSMFALSLVSFGQTTIQESFPTKAGEEIYLKFEEPHNVNIAVYDGRDVQYTGTVSINLGENDDHYELKKSSEQGSIIIRSYIRDMKSIPQWIKIKLDGEEYTFKTESWDDPQVQAFLKEKGRDKVNWMSHGPQININVQVKVPKDIDLTVYSKFGLIEMEGITSELDVTSKFGGVDLSIPGSGRYDFNIDCEWGEVFTDLDLVVPKSEKGIALKAEEFTARLNGGGKAVSVNSKHGNIYLRRQ